jgi:hypothetical protein
MLLILCNYATCLRLRRECHIQNLFNIFQSGPILIKFRCSLTCFRPVRSFHLLGRGSTPNSPWGALKNYLYSLLLLYYTILMSLLARGVRLFCPTSYMRVCEIQIGQRRGEANKHNEPKCSLIYSIDRSCSSRHYKY